MKFAWRTHAPTTAAALLDPRRLRIGGAFAASPWRTPSVSPGFVGPVREKRSRRVAEGDVQRGQKAGHANTTARTARTTRAEGGRILRFRFRQLAERPRIPKADSSYRDGCERAISLRRFELSYRQTRPQMSGQPTNPELQEALLELSQYLSDSVPPLVVADSMQVLMKYPPQAVLPTIRAWTAAQYRGAAASSVPISDYLFHALKKIHMMGEFRLVPREPLDAYIATLKPVVLPMCPEEDRAMLIENLSHLGEQATADASPVQTIFRQAGGESGSRSAAPTRAQGAAAGSASASAGGSPASSGSAASAADSSGSPAEAMQGFRRFSLLLERLEASGALRTSAPAGPGGAAPAAGGAAAPAGAGRGGSARVRGEELPLGARARGVPRAAEGDGRRGGNRQRVPRARAEPARLDAPRIRRRGRGGAGERRARRDAPHHHRGGGSRGRRAPLPGDGQGGHRPLQRGVASAGRSDAGARGTPRRGEEGRRGHRRGHSPQVRRDPRVRAAPQGVGAPGPVPAAAQGARLLHRLHGQGTARRAPARAEARPAAAAAGAPRGARRPRRGRWRTRGSPDRRPPRSGRRSGSSGATCST